MRPRHAGWWAPRLLALGLAAMGCAPASADTRITGAFHGTLGGPEPGQGINLHVERRDLDVTYADDRRGDRLEVGRIGIAWFESLAPGLRLGVSLGRQGVDRNDRSVTAGLAPEGYYAAIEGTGHWPIGERFALALGGHLGYAEASDRDDTAGVELDWWSASLRPMASLLLGERVELRAGVRVQWLDGDERTTGSNPASVPFTEDGLASGFASLGLYTGDGGRVAIEAEGGAVRALRLVFERQY